MSYILDALKKSEAKRGNAPIAASAPVIAAPTKSKLQRMFVLLAFIILALLAGWMLAQWQQTAQQVHEDIAPRSAIPSPATPSAAPPSPASPSPATPSPATPSPATPTPAKPNPLPALSQLKQVPVHIEHNAPMFTSLTAAPPSTTAKHIVAPVDQHSAVEGSRINGNSPIVSLRSLPIAQQQMMPVINIEGHIYDADPSARMVIINGKVRKEKQMISAGLRLQEITADGVILQYKGTLYRMGVFDQ